MSALAAPAARAAAIQRRGRSGRFRQLRTERPNNGWNDTARARKDWAKLGLARSSHPTSKFHRFQPSRRHFIYQEVIID